MSAPEQVDAVKNIQKTILKVESTKDIVYGSLDFSKPIYYFV